MATANLKYYTFKVGDLLCLRRLKTGHQSGSWALFPEPVVVFGEQGLFFGEAALVLGTDTSPDGFLLYRILHHERVLWICPARRGNLYAGTGLGEDVDFNLALQKLKPSAVKKSKKKAP